MKAPFPYFGGKSRIAGEVWKRFGTVKNYVEPFLWLWRNAFNRPDWEPGIRLLETVNDKDGFLSNFWRAVAADPSSVAYHADWPVNENDLLMLAIRGWLISVTISRPGWKAILITMTLKLRDGGCGGILLDRFRLVFR
jgi:DNA adenine methylase